jgi:hypothetical protein
MDHFITLDTAVKMTSLYRITREEILKPEFQNQNILCLSETFDRAAIDQVLAEPDCSSIRIYYGMNDDKTVHAVVVGVDSKNQDILPASATTTSMSTSDATTDDTVLLENGGRCPDLCPPTSPLNP